jgi:hypothetical protein
MIPKGMTPSPLISMTPKTYQLYAFGETSSGELNKVDIFGILPKGYPPSASANPSQNIKNQLISNIVGGAGASKPLQPSILQPPQL